MNPPFARPDLRSSYRYLLRWIALGGAAGVMGASVLALFTWLVDAGQGALLSTGVPVPLAAIAAALIVGGLVYRVSPDAAGEGIPSYLYALNRAHARFPLRVTLMKFPAAVITLMGFGSGGVVGPVGRVTSGLASLIGSRHGDEHLRMERSHTAAVCGMAATVAALFHAPIGGGVFAVEIVQRANMRYRDLFPAVLAGAVSVGFSRLMGWQPLIEIVVQPVAIELGLLPWTIGFSLVVGLIGSVYVRGYGLAVKVFRRDQGQVVLKVAVGMAAASLLVWLVNPALLGTASGVTRSLSNGDFTLLYGAFPASAPLALVALAMMVVRMAGSYLTTGSGMSAGLTAPAIQLGMLSAVAAAELVRAVAGPDVTGAFLAVGFAGMLAGSMNVPIAAAVLAVEVFGTGMGMPAIFASVIAFQMNRHSTIYDFALAGSGHMDEAGPA